MGDWSGCSNCEALRAKIEGVTRQARAKSRRRLVKTICRATPLASSIFSRSHTSPGGSLQPGRLSRLPSRFLRRPRCAPPSRSIHESHSALQLTLDGHESHPSPSMQHQSQARTRMVKAPANSNSLPAVIVLTRLLVVWPRGSAKGGGVPSPQWSIAPGPGMSTTLDALASPGARSGWAPGRGPRCGRGATAASDAAAVAPIR